MYLLLFFLILPFIAFVFSLRDLRKTANAIVFVAFYSLFGFAQDFGLVTSDIYRLGWLFIHFEDRDLVKSFLEGSLTDFYLWFMFAIVRPLTGNPKILLSIMGLIYGFLTYKCLLPIYKFWTNKRDYSFYIIVFVFLSNISLVHFTGIRFYTGALFLCYCILNLIIYKKRQYLFISLFAVLFHFGFLPIVIAVFLYFIFFQKVLSSNKRLISVLSISFILSFIPLKSFTNQFVNNMDMKENMIQYKFSAYSSEKTSKQNDDTSFYRQANSIFTSFFNEVNKIGSYILLLVLIKNYRYSITPNFTRKLLPFTVYLFSFSYICIAAISSGMRMMNVAWVFALLLFAVLLARDKNKRWLKWDRYLLVINFYSICFLLINAPRLASPLLWIMNVPFLIAEGIDFKMPFLN